MAVIPRMRRGVMARVRPSSSGMSSGTARISAAREAVESFVEHAGEAAGGGGLRRRLEVKPDGSGAPPSACSVSMVRNSGDWHSTTCSSSSGWSLQPLRKLRQPLRELQQQLQPLGFGQGLEIVDNFRQCGGEG